MAVYRSLFLRSLQSTWSTPVEDRDPGAEWDGVLRLVAPSGSSRHALCDLESLDALAHSLALHLAAGDSATGEAVQAVPAEGGAVELDAFFLCRSAPRGSGRALFEAIIKSDGRFKWGLYVEILILVSQSLVSS